MFNIGAMELLVVLVVAFLVVGPKDLPKVARWIARQVKNVRKFVKDVMQETGMNELTKELKDTKSDIEKTMRDADISKELQTVADEIEHGVDSMRTQVQDAARAVEESKKE